jgi:hypothetical protein
MLNTGRVAAGMNLDGPFNARIAARSEFRRIATVEFNRRYATNISLVSFSRLIRPG